MLKEKWKLVCNFVLKHSKLMLPVLLILVVAVVVAAALSANDSKDQQKEAMQELLSVESQPVVTEAPTQGPEEIPLVENTNADLYTLICTYYNAYAYGDVEGIRAISNYVSDTDAISIPEMSKYVEGYSDVAVFTKEGPVDNSYLAYVYYKMKMTGFEDLVSGMETFYVCTKEDGTLYLNKLEATEEELEYIKTVSLQEDVAELYNRVTVECSDTFANNEDLYYYVQEVVNEVQKATGEQLAAQISGESSGEESVVDEDGQTESTEGTEPQEGQTTPEETTGPVYAKATTTVNVRASDSENADRVDKITGGTKVEVLEQKVNGWSKVLVNGKEGYIKSEFLNVITVVNSGDAIGTVTASSNVNVRETPSESGERLGTLPGGTTVDLLARENGWCKINYNGQVGYVKEDYVE